MASYISQIKSLRIPTIKSISKNNTYKTYKDRYKNAGKNETIRINQLLDRVNNMGNFDADKSGYYQQAYNAARQQYLNQGRQDMRNAQATASTLTGGYGNSFGTTSGSAAYQQSLNNLNALIPQLQSQAMNIWNQQKSDMLSLVGTYQQERSNAQEQAWNLLNNFVNQFYTQQNNAQQTYTNNINRLATLEQASRK